MKNPVKDASGEKEETLNRLRKAKDLRPSQDEIDVTIVDRDLEGEIVKIKHKLYPKRVLRGGCWGDDPRGVRASDRFNDSPSSRDGYLGFRIVRSK